jgi:hypothetical protein
MIIADTMPGTIWIQKTISLYSTSGQKIKFDLGSVIN